MEAYGVRHHHWYPCVRQFPSWQYFWLPYFISSSRSEYVNGSREMIDRPSQDFMNPLDSLFIIWCGLHENRSQSSAEDMAGGWWKCQREWARRALSLIDLGIYFGDLVGGTLDLIANAYPTCADRIHCPLRNPNKFGQVNSNFKESILLIPGKFELMSNFQQDPTKIQQDPQNNCSPSEGAAALNGIEISSLCSTSFKTTALFA